MTPSVELLLFLGPPLLFAMAAAETSLPIGLLVPAGVALSLGAFLAFEGILGWGGVVGASVGGALAGDSIGFWIGRRGSAAMRTPGGFATRFFGRYQSVTRRFYGRRPFVSVTLARTVSFVRTLMPTTAGLSGMTYLRFLVYDVGGVVLWAGLYISVGVLAGESWKVASGVLGTGWAVLLSFGALGAWLAARRRRQGEITVETLFEPMEPVDALDSMEVPDEAGDAHGRPRESLSGGGMKQIGLTGNVASGKSTVARAWERAGVPVIDADRLAREAVAPGSEGLARVVERFGAEVLDSEGALDRDRMRARILADPAAKEELEAILHPEISRLRERWIEARATERHPIVVSEIPLLYEVGLEDAFDAVVVVHSPEAVRLDRLVRERGMDPEEARRLIAAQGDPEAKRRRADHVILNEGSLETLEAAALALLETLRSEG